jgi:hypothetical protein
MDLWRWKPGDRIGGTVKKWLVQAPYISPVKKRFSFPYVETVVGKKANLIR